MINDEITGKFPLLGLLLSPLFCYLLGNLVECLTCLTCHMLRICVYIGESCYKGITILIYNEFTF